MHKYLRSVGFSSYQKRKEIEKLLNILEQTTDRRQFIQIDPESKFCEVRAEVAPGMGIVMAGEVDEYGFFHREYYYPYLTSMDDSSSADCSIQKKKKMRGPTNLLSPWKWQEASEISGEVLW